VVDGRRPTPGYDDVPIEPERRLSAMYDAFNERDMDTAMDQMAADVDWPKAWEAGRALGRDGLRDYWSRMWAAIDVKVEPLEFTSRADGTIAVLIQRVVRDVDGRLIDQRRSVHVHVLRNDLIARMDVEEPGDRA
jgi:hypothetical protein